MLRWILLAIGFLVAMGAIFIGVVMFLFNREEPDMSNLTELHTAQVLELSDFGSGYRVVYEYVVGSQVFYGKETVSSKSMEEGSPISVCLDPTDPALHSFTYSDCGPGGPVRSQEAVTERPEP